MVTTMAKQTDMFDTFDKTRFVLMALCLLLLGAVPLPILCHSMPYHWLTITIGAINILGAIMVSHTEAPDYNEHGHRIITGQEVNWKMQTFGWGSVIGLIISVSMAVFF